MPSSVIRAFDYRPAQLELEILFTTGRRYVYFGVPSSAVSALRTAPSKGRYFNARIRDRYHFAEQPGSPAKRGVNGA